jgi:hypothetical protein
LLVLRDWDLERKRTARCSNAYWLICLLSFVSLVVVQRTVNELNAHVAPDADRNDRFTRANLVWIVSSASSEATAQSAAREGTARRVYGSPIVDLRRTVSSRTL